MMLKTGLVTSYYPSHRGGVEIAAGHWAQEALKRWPGLEVQWVATRTDEQKPAAPGLDLIPCKGWNGIEERVGIPFPLWGPSSKQNLSTVIRNTNCIMVHEPYYSPCINSLRIAKRMKTPSLLVLHAGVMEFRNPILNICVKGMQTYLAKIACSRATKIVAISETTRQFYKWMLGDEIDILTIPNGIDCESFSLGSEADREEIRLAMGAEESDLVALFVGRFVERKGIEAVREIARKLPGMQFWLAGWGPTNPQSWGLQNIQVISGKKSKELAAFYRAADVLILPSPSEGFPLVVQEGMRCGLTCTVGNDTDKGAPRATRYIQSLPVDAKDPVQTAAVWSSHLNQLDLASLRDKTNAQRRSSIAKALWGWSGIIEQYKEIILGMTSCNQHIKRAI